MTNFVHLRVHSEYSLADSIIRVPALLSTVRERGMPAVALTDWHNLFAEVKFYREALKQGVKPLIGVDCLVASSVLSKPSELVLLVQNEVGYKHLTWLISEAYQRGQVRGVPIIDFQWLVNHTEGLIALSGGRGGELGQLLLSGQSTVVTQRLSDWQDLFPDRFYLEIQRTGRVHEEEYVQQVVDLALKCDLPLVATNDVRFLDGEEFSTHEARVCIHDGHLLSDEKRPQCYSPQQYLRSPDEMAELFSDLPDALENTQEIAKRCNFRLHLGENFLPDFPVPAGQTMESYFRELSEQGLEERFNIDFCADNTPDLEALRAAYEARLKIELDVINQMGFPGYFLIVSDFIRWAKDHDIPVGPGRGSGAGSLVAYALRITDIDPLQYDLLFERFLNPERVSLPDFDVDFCMEQRDRVIDYVARHYGREKVSQIVTYGSMKAKAVVRDVGRVLGNPYGFVDAIAKLIPFDLKMTLSKALEEEEELQRRYDSEEEVKTLLDLAMKLEGLARNAGKHAGGVVIAPSKLTDFTPLYCEEDGSSLVTQLDKDDVESVGLVKFDFLGLRTLTIIHWAVQTINRQLQQDNKELLDIDRIPLDDENAFAMLKRGETTAVFQLESRGIKEMIKRLLPDNFEDIIALVALYRPGPLESGMVDDFIERKHGRAAVDYPHDSLESILKPTYGVILYQEQVMQIAQELSGYTLGGADMLRRAMGKKKQEVMDAQRAIFLEGAKKNQVEEQTAASIFDLIALFAKYGFNKSHSAAYALVSYQTLWLKSHYPAAFMAAVLSSDMDNTDKMVLFVEECRRMNIPLLEPDIEHSQIRFSVENKKAVRYGLGAIKGVGEAALENVLAERQNHGTFVDLFDLCARIDSRKVNKRVLEALIRAGALDSLMKHEEVSLGKRRAVLANDLPVAMKQAEQQQNNQQSGQADLFGLGAAVPAIKTTYNLAVDAWVEDDVLAAEKATLGHYLSGHPINQHKKELANFVTATPSQIATGRVNGKAISAGLLSAKRIMRSRRGDKIAFVTLEDQFSRLEVSVFAEAFSQCGDVLESDGILVVSGEVVEDDYNGGMQIRAEKLWTLDSARALFAKGVVLSLTDVKASIATELPTLLSAFRDNSEGCPIQVNYQRDGVCCRVSLGVEWRIRPAAECLQQLDQLYGVQKVELIY